MVSETPSESQHQVVGIVEVVQFVAYVQEKIPVQVGFQSQGLVEPFQFVALVDEVTSETDVDRKDRHDKLSPCRQSYTKLLTKRRAEELDVSVITYSCYMLADIGALIVLDIERQSGSENLLTLYKGLMFKPMIPNFPLAMYGVSFQNRPFALPAP